MSDLKKSIGFPQLIALGAAGVVGTSWIYTNGRFFTLYDAGGVIFGLVIATVFVSFIAVAYGELASTFPRAGGEVIYGYVAFNRTISFLAGWLLIGAYVSSLAFYVTAFGFLLVDLFPGLETIPLYTINDTTVHLPILAVGLALTLLIFGLNWYGVQLGAQFQLVLFGALIVLGVALVVVGFATGSAANFWPPYTSEGSAPLKTLRFILPAMTFLTGFALITMLAEDARMSARTIGRTVVATVVVAGTFYTLVLLSSAWVIPWTQTATLEQGTIDAFRVAGFPVLGWSAYAISVLGLLTSFLALFVATSRIVLALSRGGLFPAGLGHISPRRGTPTRALLFTLAATLGLGWLGTGAIVWFLDTGGVYVGLAWVIGVLSLYRIGRRYPTLERPYRVRQRWAPAVGAVLALLVIGFALTPGTDLSLVWPYEYAILLAWFILGAILYAAAPRRDDDLALQTLLGDEHYRRLHDGAAAGPKPVSRR